MAREIESVHKFVHQPHPLALKKGKMVVRCKSGHIYEFERAVDAPRARLVRGFKPDGTVTHLSNGRLPSAVEETARSVLGVFDR